MTKSYMINPFSFEAVIRALRHNMNMRRPPKRIYLHIKPDKTQSFFMTSGELVALGHSKWVLKAKYNTGKKTCCIGGFDDIWAFIDKFKPRAFGFRTSLARMDSNNPSGWRRNAYKEISSQCKPCKDHSLGFVLAPNGGGGGFFQSFIRAYQGVTNTITK